MLHFPQKTNVTCGAAAYRTALSQFELISEKQACDEVKNDKWGTNAHNILNAFKKRGLDANLIELDTDWNEYSRWLALNSKNRLLILDCQFNDKAGGKGQGRDRIRLHYIVVSNEFVYDPAHQSVCPLECYLDIHNKKVTIRSMIMIDVG